MAKHVLPWFQALSRALTVGLLLSAGLVMGGTGSAQGGDCRHAAAFGQVGSRPVPGRPAAPGSTKPLNAKDKEKVEIPHMLDWLNDDWVIISALVAVFLLIILWVYVKVLRRLDTAAYLQRPSPRGVLYVPQEIVELVDGQLRGQPAPAAERQKLIDSYTLRYYFGGQEVVCRQSPQGLAVLAAGADEVQALLGKMTPEEKATVRVEKPEPWDMGPSASSAAT